MKYTSALILLVITASASAQQVLVSQHSNDEPIALFTKANELLHRGDAETAITMFEKIGEFYCVKGRRAELAENYFAMALSLALNGNYRESIRFHKKAIKAHRKYKAHEPTEILINLGLVYQLSGNHKKAKKYLS